MGRSCPEVDHWSDRDDPAIVGLDQLPAAFVNHPMMPATEEDEVVQVCVSSVDPMHHVMSVAP